MRSSVVWRRVREINFKVNFARDPRPLVVRRPHILFATDMQAQLMAVNAVSDGAHIDESIRKPFMRFEMQRMGADMQREEPLLFRGKNGYQVQN